MQTVFWMDAFLYLMLYAAIWYGLARYRSPKVVLWSVSGIASAVGLCVLGSRGWISYSLIVVLGQFLMAAGNWGRQIALRSLDGPPSRRWMVWSGLANVVYLGLSYGLHFSGAPESTIVLLFYAYYSVNCADYCWSGRRVGQTHDAIGANAVYWAGWVLVSTLGLKTLALLTGWGATDLYEGTWDNFVVFIGQFVALIMLNVGFMQIYIEKHHRAKIEVEKKLASEQERAVMAQQHSQTLGVLLLERDENIRQLTLSNKSAGMGALVASFAHELNQPLTAILLHAELLQSKLARVPNEPPVSDLPMMRSVADCIVSDTQRSASIIRKLRNLFRLSKGEKVDMRVDQLVREVADLLQPQMQASGILMNTDLSSELRFHGDATQLQQVVLNLLSNAMDALIEKRPRYPQLKVWGYEQEGFLELHVDDNGKGIPVELQDEVFSLFKTSKSQGMGVGLWLSRSIVESHGGQLSFKSEPGRGTVFTMRLPCSPVPLAS